MNSDNAHAAVLGIDFGGTKVELRVEHADGSGIDERLEIGDNEPAASVIRRALDTADRLIDEVGGVAAAGISTPGIVFDDRVELAPNVAGWTDLTLAAHLRERLGDAPLVIENDVKAAALAECKVGALQGADPGLYVNLGTGIAIAPVIGGTVLRGAHGAAGEIGYGVVGVAPDWSGAGAPLEEFAGGGGLARRVAAALDVPAADLPQLVAARSWSSSAADLWDDAVDELARHLLTAILTIDPSKIVIGGGMTRAGDALLTPLRARFVGALPYPPEIVLSNFGTQASLRGALILARSALKNSTTKEDSHDLT